MELKMKQFVLSASEFDTAKEAEEQTTQWFEEGTLNMKTKLYKVVEIYDLKLKFVKRK